MTEPREPTSPELEADLAAAAAAAAEQAQDSEPAAPRRPVVRRRVVGPFSLRQVTIAIVTIMAAATVLTVATLPLGTIEPGLPKPEPSAFLIGSPIPGLHIGDLAPELAFDRPEGPLQLTDLDGAPLRLEDLRGKVVWINFWASWCPPCQFETPIVRSMDQRYRDRGLVIVAIQVQQTVQAGRDYAARYELEYTIGADVTGSIFRLYRGFALPTQFFLDTDGRIREIVLGPLDEARAIRLIESLLPAGAAPSTTPSPLGTLVPTRTP